MSIETGYVLGCARQSPNWDLHAHHGARTWRHSVVFKREFDNTPEVFVAFRLIDAINEEKDIRLSCTAQFISSRSFTVCISTWSDSRLWSAEVTWVAYDKQSPLVAALELSFGTEKFHKNDAGYNLHEGVGTRSVNRRLDHKLPNAGHRVPTILTGFNMLDITNSPTANASILSHADRVDAQSFSLNVSVGDLCNVWSTEVAWIAFYPYESALYRLCGKSDSTSSPPIAAGAGPRHVSINAYGPANGEQFFPSSLSVASFLSGFVIPLHNTAETPSVTNSVFDGSRKPATRSPTGVIRSDDMRISVKDDKSAADGFYKLIISTWNSSSVQYAEISHFAFGDTMAAHEHDSSDDPYDDEENSDDDDDERAYNRRGYYDEDSSDELHHLGEEYGDSDDSSIVSISDDSSEEAPRAPAIPAPAQVVPTLPPRTNSKIKRDASLLRIFGADIPNKKFKTGQEDTPEKAKTEEEECKICMENVINSVLIPCGHLVICYNCAYTLCESGGRSCPVCKKTIMQVIKTYKS